MLEVEKFKVGRLLLLVLRVVTVASWLKVRAQGGESVICHSADAINTNTSGVLLHAVCSFVFLSEDESPHRNHVTSKSAAQM